MDHAARPFCYRCRHAQKLCVCDEPRIPTRTRVLIVQHEDEAWNQIGTARLTHLMLPNSALVEGLDFADDPRLAQELAFEGREPVLLYPTPTAIPLEELRDEADRLTLVVVDGTWPQAKNIVRYTPALRSLRRVRILAGEKSRYRIRLQPRAECISTLEATVRALGAVEGEPERFRPLVAAFERMVDRHVAAAAAEGRQIIPDVNARRARRPLPEILAGPLDRHVIVQGETLWWFPPGAVDRQVDLVQWSAIRVATGERFDALIQPTRPWEEREARYLDLTPLELSRGMTHAEFAAEWARFVRPDDVFVSWDFFASNALALITGKKLGPHIDLRRTTKHVLNQRVRRPEDAALEIDAQVGPPLARGRCGNRLAGVVAILDSLRAARKLTKVIGVPAR